MPLVDVENMVRTRAEKRNRFQRMIKFFNISKEFTSFVLCYTTFINRLGWLRWFCWKALQAEIYVGQLKLAFWRLAGLIKQRNSETLAKMKSLKMWGDGASLFLLWRCQFHFSSPVPFLIGFWLQFKLLFLTRDGNGFGIKRYWKWSPGLEFLKQL